MRKIYIVIMGASNEASRFQFAFHSLEEATKFRDYLDKDIGASKEPSIIRCMPIYDSALQLMKKES